MTTQESEVDVLARIDAAIGSMQIFNLGTDALLEARAAVTGVFEEAKNALDGLELSGLSFAATRLRAALRNAGVKV